MILNPAIDSGNPCRRGWELMIANHGKLGFTDAIEAATDKAKMGSDPREEGLGWRRRAALDALLVPSDARGIRLACGLVADARLGDHFLLLGSSIPFATLAVCARL